MLGIPSRGTRASSKPRRSTRSAAAALAVAAAFVAMFTAASPAFAANQYKIDIINLDSGLRVDVPTLTAGQKPYLWFNDNSTHQSFDVLWDGNGFFRLKTHDANLCLAPHTNAASYANGNKVILVSCAGAAGSPLVEWFTRSVNHCETGPDGRVCSSSPVATLLVNRDSHLCLNADSNFGHPHAGSTIMMWACLTDSEDQWIGDQDFSLGVPMTGNI